MQFLEGPEVRMNKRISQAAVLVLATVPMVAQQRTGVSNPEPVTIDANNNQDAPATSSDEGRRPLTAAKSSAAKTESSGEVYGAYVPYNGPKAAGAAPVTGPQAV